jgi:methionine-rich copper-binding protein CopC
MRHMLRALSVMAALAAATTVQAHSELRGSTPANGAQLQASPPAIVLNFNELVQVTAARLYREGGAEVALPRPRAADSVRMHQAVPPQLEPGRYRLEWRIISADGHPVGGVIRFSVGTP